MVGRALISSTHSFATAKRAMVEPTASKTCASQTHVHMERVWVFPVITSVGVHLDGQETNVKTM